MFGRLRRGRLQLGSPTDEKPSGFRPDIEGLRALAVTLVIGAHASVPGMQGGFVGVDVFFVLSGYLITRLLFAEWQGGRVHLARFFARRMQRLLPALLLMLVATSILATIFLAPFEHAAQISGAMAAISWVSNIYLALSDLPYFDAGSEENLFLHTWSLGVEEQFYVLWPLLFVGVGWLASKKSRNDRLLQTFGAVVIWSLLALWEFSQSHPAWSFYLMPARAWQFGLGAIASLSLRESTGWSHSKWLGYAGLGLLLTAAVGFRPDMPYPSGWVLIPTLGALGIIVAGTLAPGLGVARILSWGPFLRVGKISYALYLWHWPLLGLGHKLWGDAWYVRCVAVLLAVVLAALSNRFVEAPVRKRDFGARRPWLVLVASLLVIVGVLACTVGWREKAAVWGQQSKQQLYSDVRWTTSQVYNRGCDDWFRSANLRPCSFGDPKAAKTLVLIGDSVVAQWFPALKRHLPEGWNLLVLTKSSCPMVDAPFFYPRIGANYDVCERWRDDALAYVQSLRPAVVVTGEAFTYPFSAGQWRDGSRKILQALAGAADKLVVLRGTLPLPFDGPACLARRDWAPRWAAGIRSCSVSVRDAGRETAATLSHDVIWQIVQEAGLGLTNISFVDLTPLVCPNAVCAAQKKGVVVFRDFQHVSVPFAKSIGPLVVQQIVGHLGLVGPGESR